ncbi:hypothetical protein BDU57DRAFT_178644 [Ampelomyces quisqualis]|uniref:Uncharacterized protein n=1 Tax=Ampelomyces quisqualis TaxID=50730 RepID=A0A6A5QQB1_AMPQU|nr:hypothetical protein BDU57DRAFT_178644 [Ampelomyces quisqualis]
MCERWRSSVVLFRAASEEFDADRAAISERWSSATGMPASLPLQTRDASRCATISSSLLRASCGVRRCSSLIECAVKDCPEPFLPLFLGLTVFPRAEMGACVKSRISKAVACVGAASYIARK